MKKLLSMILASAMTLTIFAGCGSAAVPDSVSSPDPVDDVVEAAPVPATLTAEGVVKETAPDRIVIDLADGSSLVLDTTGIAGPDVRIGDSVRAEYSGEIGSAAAVKVEVTAKAAPEPITAVGTVAEVSASMVMLTLEDGTELALNVKAVEGLAVKEGDIVTVEYANGGNGAVAASMEVIGTAEEPEEAPVSDAAASAAGASAGTTGTTGGASSSSQSSGTSGGPVVEADGSWNLYWWYNGDDADYEDEGGGDDHYDEEVDNSDSSEPAGDVYEAVRLINAERAKVGLAALTTDPELMEMAAIRAEEASEVFESTHVRPDGRGAETIYADFGWEVHKYAENLGRSKDTASKQVESWMNSTGHKKNILRSDVTKIGVGYYYTDNTNQKHYWSMLVTN